MPSLGSDMTEGMLVEWLIKVGDKVKHGDVIAVLETQKGAIDMEVYQDGTITQLLVQPLKNVPVGTVLARLKESEAAPSSLNPRYQNPLSKTKQHSDKLNFDQPGMASVEQHLYQPQQKSLTAVQTHTSRHTVNASPIARKMANEQQLNLSIVRGTGFNDAVILKDIEAFINEPNNQGSLTTNDDKLANMRSAIAKAMSQSKRDIPHFYLSSDITINKAQQWLQQTNQDKDPQQQILLIALLLKAIAITLTKYPGLNGFYHKDRFEPVNEINIANVISLRTGGVVVPLIQNVDQLSLHQIMQALRDMTLRSRSLETGKRLRSSELSGASITITNMGERGADRVFGIIYPPQVAIIGLGKVKKVAQVYGEKINVGEQLTVCLSADHRVVDGMLAAKFLNSLAKKLQYPEQL